MFINALEIGLGGAIAKSHTLLIILVGIQIALTLVLVVKLGSFENHRNTVAQPIPLQTSAKVAIVPDEPKSVADHTRLSEFQLRRIVREELLRVMPADAVVESEKALSQPVLDPVEMQYQRKLVVQELEYLKEQDVVTTAELDKLLGDIAHLDPESRIDLLGMLNRAMNRGEIKGNL